MGCRKALIVDGTVIEPLCEIVVVSLSVSVSVCVFRVTRQPICVPQCLVLVCTVVLFVEPVSGRWLIAGLLDWLIAAFLRLFLAAVAVRRCSTA